MRNQNKSMYSEKNANKQSELDKEKIRSLYSIDITNKEDFINKINDIVNSNLSGYFEIINLDLSKLGIHKSEYWEFQHEWRYRLSFIRMQYISNAELAEKVATDTMRRMIKGIETPPIDYYDLDIAEDCFSQMEITCSPQMTLGNRILLESLVEKYNPSAQIIDSELLGKL